MNGKTTEQPHTVLEQVLARRLPREKVAIIRFIECSSCAGQGYFEKGTFGYRCQSCNGTGRHVEELVEVRP